MTDLWSENHQIPQNLKEKCHMIAQGQLYVQANE